MSSTLKKRAPHNGETWTPERIQRLKTLYDAGEPYETIANQLGLAESSISALLSRFYPERLSRRTLSIFRLGEDALNRMAELYGQAATYEEIAFELAIEKHRVSAHLTWLKENRPELMREIRARRTAIFAEMGRDSMGRIKNHRNHQPRAAIKQGAYTPLDEAIDYLRKFAPCHRDKNSGLIVYGRTRKTEDEIMALADRKQRQAEAWKAGAL